MKHVQPQAKIRGFRFDSKDQCFSKLYTYVDDLNKIKVKKRQIHYIDYWQTSSI